MNKVLVVVDMQNDFINMSLGSPEAQAIVPKVVDLIKNWSEEDEIILTADTHQEDYLNTPEGLKLPVEHCIENSKGWQIHDDILNIDMDTGVAREVTFIRKPTFGSVDLMIFLQKEYEKNPVNFEVHFCGLCTDICVVSNVLMTKAFFPDIKIVLHADCCAGVTPEKHQAAIETMKSCQIDVIGE